MAPSSNNLLTPKEIVAELDRFIVGQQDAKKAVAVALRNRWRRKQVKGVMREEIMPKNILMIGPTGVGKTEIARRMAKLVQAPFIKVEATKFTEVGYVGRDVDSIIRDLMEVSVNITRTKFRQEVTEKAKENAQNKILDALVGVNAMPETRKKFLKMLKSGKLDDKEIEIAVQDHHTAPHMPSFDIPGMPGGQMGVINVGEMLSKALGGAKTKTKTMKVKEANDILINEESDKLLDEEKIIAAAVELIENDGIVFLDEIDKIATRNDVRGGEVSREGVQRDLLPLIEGTIVSTKFGPIKTDHILFISSGAFHTAKPADLLPELQGRLPIRVELKDLTQEDLVRILKEPESSLLKQNIALMATEDIALEFTEDGIAEIARVAAVANKEVENIGARRLHTIMEKLLEHLSFNACDSNEKKVIVDESYVKTQLADISQNIDLSKFIL
jgi:ATP-dependent HslUV protease ATP-binding subunit HslU